MRRSRNSKYCDHCQKPGHVREQCFKLVGYPEWYESNKGKKKVTGGARMVANVSHHVSEQESPLDDDSCSKKGLSKSQFDSEFIQALAQEVMKLSYGKHSMEGKKDTVGGNFAHFAGNVISTGFTSICCAAQDGTTTTWIVDTGASDHMAYDSTIFVNMAVLPRPISITLPDGSSKTVTLVGDVVLANNIRLKRVLYVAEFKFNLLSVTRLLTDQRLGIHIYPTTCIF